jgi:hypothetical protein
VSISISSSSSTASVETYEKSSVKQLSANELEVLKKKPTTVETSGDIYTSSTIHFKKLSLQELKMKRSVLIRPNIRMLAILMVQKMIQTA